VLHIAKSTILTSNRAIEPRNKNDLILSAFAEHAVYRTRKYPWSEIMGIIQGSRGQESEDSEHKPSLIPQIMKALQMQAYLEICDLRTPYAMPKRYEQFMSVNRGTIVSGASERSFGIV
jgi:hypothetical protein